MNSEDYSANTALQHLAETIDNFSMPSIDAIRALDVDISKFDRAEWKYEVLRREIEDFQNGLTDAYDVCVKLASFGTNVLMSVDEIGYQNPDILFFYGTVEGNPAQLIQHSSQLNFMLLAMPKREPGAKPRRIGFQISEESDE